jgi:AraC-like DNA-binding protein
MQTMLREQESARITLVQWDTPFEILRGTYTRHRFAPHLHETFSLGAIEAGASRIRYRGRTVAQRAGDVVVIPAREVHTGEADCPEGWSYRMFYLPLELMSALGVPEHTEFEAPTVADPELARRVIDVHTLLEGHVERLRGQTALAELLQILCAKHSHTQIEPSRVEPGRALLGRVRDYLEEHYAKPISLLELSAVSGVSPFHLSRRFRARYGLPPYMYLEMIRVDRARDLLRQGEPISRVAFDTGFSDQSHLTRRFKRVVGVPPGQYARTYGLGRSGVTRVA